METTPKSTFWGSEYRSPYPYYKRDYDVHKRIWDPYVNRPSKAQRAFEIFNFLIVLTAVPAFLGGVLQVFVLWYALFLGIFGLFSFPRRHMILWILSALCLIALLIVSIILRAVNKAACFPFTHNSTSGNFLYNDVVAPGVIQPYSFSPNIYSNYCGNKIVTFVTHGLLLGWTLMALFFAFKIATERRRRYYDYDYVGGTHGVATGLPSSGHTSVYSPPVAQTGVGYMHAVPAVMAMPTTGTTVTPTMMH